MEFDSKKVLRITQNMLLVLDEMEKNSNAFNVSTQKFNQFMQSDISENSVEISREILAQVKKTKEIINESTQNLKEGAEVMDIAEDLGRKLKEIR